jgi:multidrug efflux pump subunit AcrA (membrane-fusion protein)
VKYTVTVALDPTDKPLLFGATASVVILTGEPRAMLTVPVSAVQTGTKGEYVVVINADGSTQDVAVTSGDLVESSVTITTTGKLAEGDTVQLGASSSSSGSSNNRNNGGGILPGVGGPGGGPGG